MNYKRLVSTLMLSTMLLNQVTVLTPKVLAEEKTLQSTTNNSADSETISGVDKQGSIKVSETDTASTENIEENSTVESEQAVVRDSEKNEAQENELVKAKTDVANEESAKQEVDMPDAALKAAVNAELNSEKIDGKTDRATTDPVYDLELAQMKTLVCEKKGIKNLKGLEQAANLTKLDVAYNSLDQECVQYIAPLTNLTYLAIDQSKGSNTIITDISLLKNLINLESFYLSDNKVTDISVVRNMPKLNLLKLRANRVTNFEPLKELMASGTLKTLDAINQDILAEKQEVTGAQVQLDPVKMIMPDGTEVSTPTNLSEGVFQDGKITLNWSENQEREISYKLNGVGTYNAITANVKQLVNFTYTGVAKQEVDMPDAALKAAVNAELNSEKINGKTDRATTDPVYDLELAQMKKLDKQKANITNLKGLEKATSLTSLTLHYNKISDLTPLENLTQLNVLNIAVMPTLTDISPIKNLTNLTQLNLGENSITDISVIK
ncbi:leucine-rich repeat domain-containing protein, partial [Enterococcus faecium]|nr:leucine-rich repeat domain-containing protein [Enterococcus faecium]